MARFISCPPNAERMLNSMRALGYSFETALADIVDNSIAAGAKSILIDTPSNPNAELYLAVVDDGKGMTDKQLQQAMQHACNNPDAERDSCDLGRFGLGMKTASLSQCREMIVVSKVSGKLSAASWNLDDVAKTGDWSLKIFEKPEEIISLPGISALESFANGTAVIWRNFDRLSEREQNLYEALTTKLDQAKEHLSLVYHLFLSGREVSKVSISVKNRQLDPKDPFMESGKGGPVVYVDEDIRIPEYPEHPISVKGYTLPHLNKMNSAQKRSLGIKDRTIYDDQGFYIYRNHRLINWGSWLRMSKKAQMTKLARVRVDIPNTMDHLWELDIKKSTAIPPKIVRDRLSILLDDLQDGSEKIQRGSGSKAMPTLGEREDIWSTRIHEGQTFSVKVNRNTQLYKALVDKMDTDTRLMFSAYLSLLEDCYPVRWVNSRFVSDESPAVSENSKEMKKVVKEHLQGFLSAIPSKENKKMFLMTMRNQILFGSNIRLTDSLLVEMLRDIDESEEI